VGVYSSADALLDVARGFSSDCAGGSFG